MAGLTLGQTLQVSYEGGTSYTGQVVLDTVVFTETGLPAGTQWSVTFNGNTLSSTSNTITFTGIQSGSYTFTVSAQGYTANPSSGTITVPSSSSSTS